MPTLNIRINAKTKRAIVGITAVGTAIAAMSALSVKKSAELETALTEVTTLLGDTTPAEAFGQSLQELESDILALSGGLGTATEVTQALYQAISAGQKPAEALAFVEQAARLATAGLSTTSEATSLLTTILNAYGLEASEVGRVSDIMFKTVERGVTTIPQLAANMGKLIPMASALKIPLEDIGAVMATLTANGLQTDLAVTALNGLFTQFVKQAGKFEAAGIDIIKVLETDGPSGGMRGAFAALKEITGGNIKEMAKLIPRVQALNAALGPTGAAADKMTGNFKAFEDVVGSTDLAFDKMSKTLAFFGKELQGTFFESLIKAGDVLKDFILAHDTAVMDAFKAAIGLVGKAISGTTILASGLAVMYGEMRVQAAKMLLQFGPVIEGLALFSQTAEDLLVGLEDNVADQERFADRMRVSGREARKLAAAFSDSLQPALAKTKEATEEVFDSWIDLSDADFDKLFVDLVPPIEKTAEAVEEVATQLEILKEEEGILKEQTDALIESQEALGQVFLVTGKKAIDVASDINFVKQAAEALAALDFSKQLDVGDIIDPSARSLSGANTSLDSILRGGGGRFSNEIESFRGAIEGGNLAGAREIIGGLEGTGRNIGKTALFGAGAAQQDAKGDFRNMALALSDILRAVEAGTAADDRRTQQPINLRVELDGSDVAAKIKDHFARNEFGILA